MPFSKIASQFDVAPNRLYAARDRLVAEGHCLTDLVSGNVHKQGLFFPTDVLAESLQEGLKRSRVYDPHPLGAWAARQSLESYYRSFDIQSADAKNILLTPGTSVSYWYVFKLLADAGDEILCPQPSYPLFDTIAQLCDLQLTSYPLRRHERWLLDIDAIEKQITSKTRAIVLISPHNPTGHVASEGEVKDLGALAERRHLTLIVDEVFSPFVFGESRLPRPCAHPNGLVLTLNGLSKMAALPGLKLGWILATGPTEKVRPAMRALEHLSDTFLPVADAAQHALPELLSRGAEFLQSFPQEIKRRMRETENLLRAEKRWTFTAAEGGFFISLQLPESVSDEAYCLKLLTDEKLLVHPGYFYDFETPHIILSGVLKNEEARRVIPRMSAALKKFN